MYHKGKYGIFEIGLLFIFYYGLDRDWKMVRLSVINRLKKFNCFLNVSIKLLCVLTETIINRFY